MITAIATFLIKRGLDKVDAFRWANRIFIAGLVIGLIAIILIAGAVFNSCKKEPKIDEENLQKINSKIDEKRDAEIEKIMVENELIETSVNQRSEESKKRLEKAEEKVREAREFDGDVSAEDLKRILEETK